MSNVQTSTDLNALLKAVILSPDEDTPRLMYADEIKELGDVQRAAFVRDDILGTARLYPGITLPVARACGVDIEPGDTEGNYHHFGHGGITLPSKRRFSLLWHRGFLEGVRGRAEDFLKHADALVWHPKQKMKCPQECVKRWHENSGSSGDWKCKGCENGYVPRPCPDTAQPIREVTLTTVPKYVFVMGGTGILETRSTEHYIPHGKELYYSQKGIAKVLCEMEWPGVTFTVL